MTASTKIEIIGRKIISHIFLKIIDEENYEMGGIKTIWPKKAAAPSQTLLCNEVMISSLDEVIKVAKYRGPALKELT